MGDLNYKQRDLESLGKHYGRHVLAMAAEGLRNKYEIAAELAWRDQVIETMTKHRDEWATEKFEIRESVKEWKEYKKELESEIARLKEWKEEHKYDSWRPEDI